MALLSDIDWFLQGTWDSELSWYPRIIFDIKRMVRRQFSPIQSKGTSSLFRPRNLIDHQLFIKFRFHWSHVTLGNLNKKIKFPWLSHTRPSPLIGTRSGTRCVHGPLCQRLNDGVMTRRRPWLSYRTQISFFKGRGIQNVEGIPLQYNLWH